MLNDFIEGLKTLQPYYNDPNGYHIGAEHDQFYAYMTDRPLTPEDVQKMHSLGWFQLDINDDEDSEDDVEYDPDLDWSTYT